MKDFFESKSFKIITWALAVLLVLSFIFKAGMVVGEMKADFSCRWSDNYHKNFNAPRAGFGPKMGDKDFLEANGALGKIMKIEGDTLVVSGPDEVEKSVLIKDDTIIKRFRDNIKKADLKIGEVVVVIGEPNISGQTEAKLIRIMPAPESIIPSFK
jgi:hypothetical protein